MKQHAGIDLLAMFPAGAQPTKAADAWTWDAFLTAAEKCHKAGFAFGLPLGVTTDSVEWLERVLPRLRRRAGRRQGQHHGEVRRRCEQAMEYLKRLAAFLPPDVGAWDNASNNKWLVSGKGALIFNPPSAWAVAKRDAPQVAEQLWTHAHAQGTQGQVRVHPAALPGRVELLQEQVGGQEPDAARLEPRGGREAGRRLPGLRPAAVRQVQRLQDLERGRPRPRARSRTIPTRAIRCSIIPFAPAPPPIADQIYTQAIAPKMVVRMVKGEPMPKTLDWAAREIEGFSRN